MADFDNKYALQIIVSNVFEVAEFKSAIRVLKFKMADPIWRPKLQKNDYFCNRSITIALNQSFLIL